jgi:predicted esterase
VPDGLPAGPAPALVAIHGYGQDPVEMFEYAIDVAGPGVVVVAPEGPSAFYRKARPASGVAYGWIADPDREPSEARNDALIDAALATRPLDPSRTVFLGYSQGVGVAVHYLFTRRDRARALVALAGGVPKASRHRLGALRGLDVLWVTGERDAAYPPDYEAELLQAMRGAGLTPQDVSLAADHALLDPARATVRSWLRE